MLKKSFFITLLLICGVLVTFGQNEFDSAKYKSRTLAEIVELNSDLKSADITVSKNTDINIALKEKTVQTALYTNLLHSQVRIKFLNKSRPISTERKDLLNKWRISLGIDEKIVNLYENEYLFKECNTEYWIPVQKQVASFFPKELKEDDMIGLFIIRIGGRKLDEKNNWDWLFLSTEFEK